MENDNNYWKKSSLFYFSRAPNFWWQPLHTINDKYVINWNENNTSKWRILFGSMSNSPSSLWMLSSIVDDSFYCSECNFVIVIGNNLVTLFQTRFIKGLCADNDFCLSLRHQEWSLYNENSNRGSPKSWSWWSETRFQQVKYLQKLLRAWHKFKN